MSSKRKQKQQARLEEAQPSQPEYEYVTPDPKTKITWPRALAGQVDDSKFVCIWPNNIDSKRTLVNGRRISIEAACENPIAEEMSEVCQYLKLTHVVEPYKSYPRDALRYGRVKVELFDVAGEPIDPDVPSRKALMRKMGELIPKLNIRKKREQRYLSFFPSVHRPPQGASSHRPAPRWRGPRDRRWGCCRPCRWWWWQEEREEKRSTLTISFFPAMSRSQRGLRRREFSRDYHRVTLKLLRDEKSFKQ